LSAVVRREPLQIAMSPSGVDKGELRPEQLLSIDENGRIVGQQRGKPSDESLLHIRIVKARGAGAVLHTHSIWNTILSDFYAADGGIKIEGYEMLKGLQGVRTHEHAEWLPIVENSQDMPALAETIGETLNKHQAAHGFLLRRHGLYSWGENLAQAKRHIEILEFLLETIGRTLHIRAQKI
jgi:methylthioribulose-1-phosphate dehydratase